jgi:teichoic acid transport system permease protein
VTNLDGMSAVKQPAWREDEFTGLKHVYEPHQMGLPPLRSYVRELWRRRQFALELSRTNLRARAVNTILGQLWLVVNPVLLGLVYFILVDIIRGGSPGKVYLANLMLCLFAFRFVSTSVSGGARSVVGGGRLILNTAFPRSLLPLSSVMTAFMRFLPMLAVYSVLHVVVGLPIGPHLLWVLPILALFVVFATGVAMFVAAVQVYFRDLRNFLPYFMRLWLYTSPVLYYVDDIPDRLQPLLALNPIYPLLGALSDVVNLGENASATFMLWGTASAAGAFVIGALFFVSREREFAVRL